MNGFLALPNAFNWTREQLADAVPLRLHAAVVFDADDNEVLLAANSLRRRLPPTGYLPARSSHSHFRVS